MTTVIKDYTTFQVKSAVGQVAASFDGLSVTQYQTLSHIGAISQNWSGFSLTGAFTPRRAISPTGATLVQLNEAFATLIMDLLKPR